MEEMETDINQLDNGLLLVEGNVAENTNDIDGDSLINHKRIFLFCHDHKEVLKRVITLFLFQIELRCYIHYIQFPELDLETSVDQTEETISVLEEENMQLQLTVNQLLERVQVLELIVTDIVTLVNSTSDSLQGEISTQATTSNFIWQTYYSKRKK